MVEITQTNRVLCVDSSLTLQTRIVLHHDRSHRAPPGLYIANL